jgi:Rieske Fe-S protein
MKRDKASTASRELDRREFVLQAGRACSLVTIGSIVGACTGNPASPSDSSSTPLAATSGIVTGGVVTFNVAGGSPLDNVGGMALVLTTNGNFLAARTSQDAVTVLTATCTHEGCAITGSADGNFACPCHGSRFDTKGGVVAGPASRPLRVFSSTFANAVVRFTL